MKTLLKKMPLVRKLATSFGMLDRARTDLLKSMPKDAVGAEIGVHLGDFSQRILGIAKPRKLFLIDPWKYETGELYKDAWFGGSPEKEDELEARYESVKTRFAPGIRSGHVVILRKDSESALASLDDGSLDFVYIDGNHLYEFVLKDLELSFLKVKSGGYITGDDYTPGGWWEGGVKRAVDEFGWKDGVELLSINAGQFVFRKR